MIVLLRIAALVALLGLLIVKSAWPEFLSSSPWESRWLAWLSWWIIVFTIVSILAAILLAPAYAACVLYLAERGLLPFFLLLFVFVGALWIVDLAWNEAVLRVCDSCPPARLLPSFTASVFGEP